MPAYGHSGSTTQAEVAKPAVRGGLCWIVCWYMGTDCLKDIANMFEDFAWCCKENRHKNWHAKWSKHRNDMKLVHSIIFLHRLFLTYLCYSWNGFSSACLSNRNWIGPSRVLRSENLQWGIGFEKRGMKCLLCLSRSYSKSELSNVNPGFC